MIFNPLPDKQAQNVTLTITGNGHFDNCYVSYGDSRYYSPKKLTVPAGSQIECHANGEILSRVTNKASVVTNGSGSNRYLVNGNATITLSYRYGSMAGKFGYAATITITDT